MIRICAGLKRVKCDSKNRSETGQEKRITYTGEEAWQKMWEKFLEYGRYTMPEKPFADKPMKITDNNYSPGEGYRELLTEEERKVLMKAVPELSDAGLEAVLRRVYNMGDEHIKSLIWKQIFAFCKDYINSELEKEKKSAETERGNTIMKRKREGVIDPKPPEILAKVLWICKHWREYWKLLGICILVLLISGMFVLPKINLFSNKSDITASTNIFADVSKDGYILRSNDFPWEISTSKDQDGNILYTIVDRRGDATAVSVVPDYPKYTVYQSYDGMVIKFTCSEDEISDFTIKLKY